MALIYNHASALQATTKQDANTTMLGLFLDPGPEAVSAFKTFNAIIWYVAEPNLLQAGLKPTKSYTNNPCYPNCCDQADGTLISSRRRSMVAKLGRLLDF